MKYLKNIQHPIWQCRSEAKNKKIDAGGVQFGTQGCPCTQSEPSTAIVIPPNRSVFFCELRTVVLLILFILTLLYPKSVSAAGYGLSIYPPLLRVNIKPDKSITQVFKIDNLTSDDKFFVARLVPFSDADLFGNPVIDVRTTAPWLSYFGLGNSNIKLGEPFLIKGASSEQLILSLTVPEDVILRDIYAVLLVSTYSNTAGAPYQGSQVSATVGSNLLITISSEAFPPTLLRVEDLAPLAGAFLKFGNYYLADNITPIFFKANIVNNGDFTAETKGLFRIIKRNGDPAFLEGILPVNVIAKTKRNILNNQGKNFSFTPSLGNLGVYRATVTIRTDNANTESSITLIFLPFKIAAGLFFALLFLILILRRKDSIDTPLEK